MIAPVALGQMRFTLSRSFSTFARTGWGGAFDLGVTTALVAIAIGWCVMRFVDLERSPVGMSTDEGLAGLHVQCYAETGKAADGRSLSLFATGLGGGLYTPFYTGALFVWTRIFGISIGSLRAMSVSFSLLTVVGLWFLARLLADRKTALLVVLAAALSPWSFQLSRLSTDAPTVPAFLVWGSYLFLRSTAATSASLGGIVLALAAYTYPPTRVQVPLLVLLLLLLERRRLSSVRLWAFLGSMLAVSLPLLALIWDGTLMGRAKDLSILADSYIQEHRNGLAPGAFVFKEVLNNLYEHLRPSYLFFSGDPNLRHSTQRIGQLGWLDTLAFVLAVAAVGLVVVRALFPQPGARQAGPSRLLLWRMGAVAVVVGAFGTLPAALCWEGVPHAYRSIGTYPAVALFTGACLSAFWRRSRIVPAAVLGLAIAQTAFFFPDYFRGYTERSYGAFDGDLRRAAEEHDMARFEQLAKEYPELGFRYYLVHNFGHSCESSRTEAQRILSLP